MRLSALHCWTDVGIDWVVRLVSQHLPSPAPLTITRHPHTTSPSNQINRKIAELGNEAAFLRSILQRYTQSRTRAQREEKERAELLARRYEVCVCVCGFALEEGGREGGTDAACFVYVCGLVYTHTVAFP